MRNRRGFAMIAAALVCTACTTRNAGPMQHDSSAIERDNSEVVRANLTMRAGDLSINSGTDKLAVVDFNYNVPSWKPVVNYNSSGGIGYLTITQPEEAGGIHISGNQKNEWDVRLNQDVPMELTAHFGAGDGHLNLGGLNLRALEVAIGAGDLDLDLRGSPKMSYTVHFTGGVGDAKIHLPSNAGIEATATAGIGGIDASGLHNDGHRYYNDALGKSNVTIHLDVQGGVGSIDLIAD